MNARASCARFQTLPTCLSGSAEPTPWHVTCHEARQVRQGLLHSHGRPVLPLPPPCAQIPELTARTASSGTPCVVVLDEGTVREQRPARVLHGAAAEAFLSGEDYYEPVAAEVA